MYRGLQAIAPRFITTGKNTGGVPNTYAQAMTNAHRVGIKPQKYDDETEQATTDADLIEAMRTELQDAEDKIITLEAAVAERDAEIKRLKGAAKRAANLHG